MQLFLHYYARAYIYVTRTQENEFVAPARWWECASNWRTKDRSPVEHPPCGDDNAFFQTVGTSCMYMYVGNDQLLDALYYRCSVYVAYEGLPSCSNGLHYELCTVFMLIAENLTFTQFSGKGCHSLHKHTL